MKQKLSLFLIIFLCFIGMGSGQSDIIISQYIETNSGFTPKGIEIFNISGGSIDFSTSNLEIYQGTNGGSCSPLVSVTSGILAVDQVWVIGTSDLTSFSITNGLSISGTTTYNFSFNGDDSLQLYLGGVLQDQFGICGVDPGSSWSSSGVSTANQNIALQNGLCDGDLDGWTDPSIRFTTVSSNPISNLSGFGTSPTPCSSSTDEVDWANIQFPANGLINLGDTFDVYAQTLETGLTDSAGQGSGIQAWIGYNTSNIDPSDASWTWVLASYNTDIGNNDEYVANIGSVIPSIGTYYYASRFQLNGGPFKYGGYNGGFWDGTTNVNGVLTIGARTLDWCNLQYPGGTNNITTGTVFEVFGQVFESGITDTPASQGANIQAWIGYSTSDTNPSSAGWTWVAAIYNPLCGANCGTPENNDEYFADIGSGLPVGTYYYATRFVIDDPSTYYYGGYNAGGGGFWDGTNNVNGILIITDPPVADVVITEIMYNSSGTDDEWIEICNISGSTQDISNYIIKVGGSNVFTFPGSTTLSDGTCITVSLGSNGDGTYNNDCPFTPDYGIGANTSNNNNLVNSSNTITIYDSTDTYQIDNVTYNTADGGDGNGPSLHVIDPTQDNSSTGTNWQEVDYGGSAGSNALTPNCIPANPEINVEGNVGAYPDIPGDASNVPAGFNNTLFPSTEIGNSSIKTFRIENLGADDLTISSITITGAHAGDFSVTNSPATTITSGANTILEITFSPSAIDARTATISIANNDANENPFEFNIQGNGICGAATISVTSFDPVLGPVATEVTITGNGFSSSSTVTINGVSATVISSSSTELVIEIPEVDYDGAFIIEDSGCKTESSTFTIINNNGNCGLTDLIMTEIYDKNGGSLAYIEIYNGTGATIDLTNYYIRRYGDATDLSNNLYTDYYFTPSLTTIADGEVKYGKISSDADTASPDFYFTTGIFAGINGEDILHLYNGNTLIDVYEIPDSNVGYSALRSLTTTGGNTVSNPSDWTHNTTESTSDLGSFPYSINFNRPTVTNPTDILGCNSSGSLSISATAGNGGSLSYQWYYYNTSTNSWEIVTNTAFPLTTVSGETSNTLSLGNSYFHYSGYQFYCSVTESGACSVASDAAQIKTETTTWNGSNWSNGMPNSNTIAIIDGNYNTNVGGVQSSFSTCSMVVNSGNTLTISDNDYVEVVNHLIVDGSIIVNPYGSFVQNNDLGTVTVANQNSITVEKLTAEANQWYEYTYWGSPVANETIGNGLAESSTNRRFAFNGANYLDSLDEIGNSGNYNSGQDDIDDDANDWYYVSGATVMQPGVGYASTLNSTIFNSTPGCPGCQIKFTFNGAFNNGIITVPVYRNDSELSDNNWNFISNPYPSAIDADLFLAANTAIDDNVGASSGAIFFWSQHTPPSNGNSGNENVNFPQSDYAIINDSGQTAGGDGITPDRFIPSCQGFFIAYDNASTPDSVSGDIATGYITFNNAMRVTGNNDLFFRGATTATMSDNKVWLNLTSDTGVFNQLLVAYVNGASNDDDGMHYDAPRNMSTGSVASFYSLIGNSEKKFAIQGKAPESLTENEVIPLGFSTIIDVPTIYTISVSQIQGEFLMNHTVYIHDKFMNLFHDLNESDYTFTSEVGEFNDRFEIVFQTTTLSTEDQILSPNDLTIVELQDGSVKFKVGKNHTISQVEIIDLLGRTLYTLKGNRSEEIYLLPQLSQSAYVAKVTLGNGQTLSKKAIKKN